MYVLDTTIHDVSTNSEINIFLIVKSVHYIQIQIILGVNELV